MSVIARFIPNRVQNLLGVVALTLLSGVATGESQPGDQTINRPKFAGRVVRAFDFEEQFTNPLPVPQGWIRAQHDPEVPRDRPGFPIWNRAKLDYSSPAYSGTGSVYLPTEGGSTSLILRHGELAVFPNADYLISARVRTNGLHHARTRMVATLIDRAGNKIEGAQVTTKLVRTRGEWELLSVFIEGTEPEAAFVEIELQLLQPEQQPRNRRIKPFTVWSQDYEGGVWFDDVVVAQVPMISLSTGTAGNVVAANQPPVLQMRVRDLTGDDLTSSIRVFDASGREVDGIGGSRGTKRLGEEWTPSLPGFGWYHAVFDVMSRGSLVGRRELDFIWEPPRHDSIARSVGPGSSLFGLRTTRKDDKLLKVLPDLTFITGVESLEMRVWDVDTEQDDLKKGSALLTSIDRIIGEGVDLGFSLAEVPMELADQAAIDHDAILGLLLDHQPIAIPSIGPFMDRYGQRVSEWRLGIDPIEDSIPQINNEIDQIVKMMDPYIPGAIVGVPWAMDRPFENGTRASTRIQVIDDPTFPDDALPDLIEQWSSTDASGGKLSIVHSVHGDTASRSGESVWSRVGWLGRRAINSWWASKLHNPGNNDIEIVLSDPWTIETGRRGRIMPTPELLVWRTLVDALGGRRAIKELDLKPGVRMLLCSSKEESNGGMVDSASTQPDGALILWLDEPTLDQAIIELPLAMGSVNKLDLFGNSTPVPLERISALNLPMHRIEVSRTPIIITGVNPQLVEFLASIRISPDRFEATTGIHEHELIVKNPWPFTIRGRVYLVEPGGYSVPEATNIDRSWEIKPRVVDFVVTGGLTERFDLDVSYSSAKISGIKDLVFDVELVADQDYGLMRVARQIELGTEAIDVDVAFKRSGIGTGQVEVAVVVTNRQQEPILVDVVALAPRSPRQESTISSIDPMLRGERGFTFDGLMQGEEVIVSVRVPDLGIQINRSVRVP